jgi:hypothetical protein
MRGLHVLDDVTSIAYGLEKVEMIFQYQRNPQQRSGSRESSD